MDTAPALFKHLLTKAAPVHGRAMQLQFALSASQVCPSYADNADELRLHFSREAAIGVALYKERSG